MNFNNPQFTLTQVNTTTATIAVNTSSITAQGPVVSSITQSAMFGSPSFQNPTFNEITVSSNAVMPGATFYQNAPIQLSSVTVNGQMIWNTNSVTFTSSVVTIQGSTVTLASAVGFSSNVVLSNGQGTAGQCYQSEAGS